MASIWGRPNMDADLDDGERSTATSNSASASAPEQPRDSKNEWSDCDNDDCDNGSDDMDGWGAPPPDVVTKQQPRLSASDLLGDPMAMFTPQPVLTFSDKPQPPMLRVEQLPPGSTVWVVDCEDVALLLKGNWDPIMNNVCCGKAEGQVVRHSGDVTFVKFGELLPALDVGLTLPRSCLSLDFIVPYDNRIEDAGQFAAGFGVGTLGPRAGNHRPTDIKAVVVRPLTQFYDAFACSAVTFESTKDGMALIQGERFTAAIEYFTHQLSTVGNASSERKELLLGRVVARLFAEQLAEALSDALQVIELSPSWPRAYLSAARCYATLGKLSQSAQMLNQTQLLLPHENDLRELQRLTDGLRFFQHLLDATPVYLRINAWYEKLLHAKRGFSVGDVVLEDRIAVGVGSIFNTEPHCWHCLIALSTVHRAAIPSPYDSSTLFCSRECCDAACSSYHRIEGDVASVSFRSATMLIHNKASASLQVEPLEIAKVAMRAFFMLVAAVGEALTEEAVHSHLVHLGLYPAPQISMDAKQNADISTLHNVLTGTFSPERRAVFTLAVLKSIYCYCAKYVLSVEHDGVSTYVIPTFASSVHRKEQGFNCHFVPIPRGIRLVAAAPIDAKDLLSISKLA